MTRQTPIPSESEMLRGLLREARSWLPTDAMLELADGDEDDVAQLVDLGQRIDAALGIETPHEDDRGVMRRAYAELDEMRARGDLHPGTCRLCGTDGVWVPGKSTADDHRAPCGLMCRASDGYPGRTHPDHCPCSKGA